MPLTLETTEMSMDLAVNEMVFYVDLPPDSQSQSLAILEQLKGLGYEPELKHYTWSENDGVPINSVCALLHRAVAEGDPEVEFAALEEQWHQLERIFGSESLVLVWGTGEE